MQVQEIKDAGIYLGSEHIACRNFTALPGSPALRAAEGRHLGSGLAVERLLQAPHEVRQPLARALVQLRLARHLVAARASAATPQLCPW